MKVYDVPLPRTIGDLIACVLGALLAVFFTASISFAQSTPCAGEKYDVGELPVTTADGIEITLVDDNTVHFDLPDDVTSATICVKAGSEEQGDGPEVITITEDSDVDHSTGKELSHVSVISVTKSSPSPSPSTPPSPSPSETPESPSPSTPPNTNTPESPTVGGGNPITNPDAPPTPRTGAEVIWLIAGAIGLLIAGLLALRLSSSRS